MLNKTTIIGTILMGGLLGLIVRESYEQGQRDLAHRMVGAINEFNASMKETEEEEA